MPSWLQFLYHHRLFHPSIAWRSSSCLKSTLSFWMRRDPLEISSKNLQLTAPVNLTTILLFRLFYCQLNRLYLYHPRQYKNNLGNLLRFFLKTKKYLSYEWVFKTRNSFTFGSGFICRMRIAFLNAIFYDVLKYLLNDQILIQIQFFKF